MITVNKLIKINYRLTGNKGLDAVQDIGGIESAIKSSYQTFGGKYLISDETDRVINTFMHLVNTQYFKDGNKRTAYVMLMIELKDKIHLSDDDAIKLVYDIANHKINKISEVRKILNI